MRAADVLVIAETRDGAPTPLSLELLALARQVGQSTAALLVGPAADAAAELAAHGADRVYHCAAASEDYESETWLPVAAELARELAPAIVLAGHTPAGAELAPRLAFRLERGIATGCTTVEVESDRVLCTRPCYGGNVRETLALARGGAVATVRSGVAGAKRDAERSADVVTLEPPQVRPRIRVLARERETAAGTRLEDAKIVVAGGRGLEGPEGVEVRKTLADTLGGAVGASRVPCDLGWVPHSWQIGLTGKTVTPDLYFAVGISGAGHHMAGCGNSRTIVAINTDAEAAIFREAQFGVLGDYRKIVPALTRAIAELKAAQDL